MKPDAIIRVRFFLPSEGGRNTPVKGNYYSCPLFIDGEGFDCRILLSGQQLCLGKTYELPIKFLYPKDALPKLSIGKKIALWEGRCIADGYLLQTDSLGVKK